jgi:hypothetical protein
MHIPKWPYREVTLNTKKGKFFQSRKWLILVIYGGYIVNCMYGNWNVESFLLHKKHSIFRVCSYYPVEKVFWNKKVFCFICNFFSNTHFCQSCVKLKNLFWQTEQNTSSSLFPKVLCWTEPKPSWILINKTQR